MNIQARKLNLIEEFLLIDDIVNQVFAACQANFSGIFASLRES